MLPSPRTACAFRMTTRRGFRARYKRAHMGGSADLKARLGNAGAVRRGPVGRWVTGRPDSSFSGWGYSLIELPPPRTTRLLSHRLAPYAQIRFNVEQFFERRRNGGATPPLRRICSRINRSSSPWPGSNRMAMRHLPVPTGVSTATTSRPTGLSASAHHRAFARLAQPRCAPPRS